MHETAVAPHDVVSLLTLGVEEEFFLLNPDGSPALVAPQVLALLSEPSHFHAEWMQYQVETVSGVANDLAALGDELAQHRRVAARAAASHGAVLVATGTPPFGSPGGRAITESDRYLTLQTRFPAAAAEVVACGCHVHVGVPSRDLAVDSLTRVRSWLPVLLALSGNSPMWNGRDSGWESYRHEICSRWPSAQMPPPCSDAVGYDEALNPQIASGNADDTAGVYWLARLSPRFPTIEIRIADTGLTVADTTLVAALCRALVATAVAEACSGFGPAPVDEQRLRVSLANAARHGLRGAFWLPETGVVAPGYAALYRLVEHVTPALRATGDLEVVRVLLARRRRLGSGAARQRTLWGVHGSDEFVTALSELSLSG